MKWRGEGFMNQKMTETSNFHLQIAFNTTYYTLITSYYAICTVDFLEALGRAPKFLICHFSLSTKMR